MASSTSPTIDDAVLLRLTSVDRVGEELSWFGVPPPVGGADERTAEQRRNYLLRLWLTAGVATGRVRLPALLELAADRQVVLVAGAGRCRLLVTAPGDIAQLADFTPDEANGADPVRVLIDGRQLPPAGQDADTLARAVHEAMSGRPVDLLLPPWVVLDAGRNERLHVDLSERYEFDFFAWTKAQARKLRDLPSHEPETIDRFNLAEEIESVGRSDKRSMPSQLRRLMAHLLKWQHQPARRGSSWQVSILDARREIATILEDSPSLVGELRKELASAYVGARRAAATEMQAAQASLPENCPYSLEQLLDVDFLPEETTP